jgi:hypothetical protein
MDTECILCAHYHKHDNSCGHYMHRGKWDIMAVCPGYECRICLHTSCRGHCGRCGKSLVIEPSGKQASCPDCTTRIGRY